MYGAGKSRPPEMMRPDVEMSDVRLTSAHEEQSDGERLSPSRLPWTSTSPSASPFSPFSSLSFRLPPRHTHDPSSQAA